MAVVFLYRWHVTGSEAGAASIARHIGVGLLAVGRGIAALPGLLWKKFKGMSGKGEESAQEATGRVSKMLESEELQVPQQAEIASVNGASFDDGKTASEWKLPSLDLLENGTVQSAPQETLSEMATCIESTMADYGVEVSVTDIKTGPRIIRFGLVPGRIKKNRDNKATDEKSSVDLGRVKVQSIVSREADLALALKTSSLQDSTPGAGRRLRGTGGPQPESQHRPLEIRGYRS